MPQRAGEEVPREADGVALEVIAEAEVAQHLEEGVVAGRVAHVLEVVVLAAGAHAALARGRAHVGARILAEEAVLELHHAGVGEQQRRVVARHQAAGRDDAVPLAREVVEEGAADFSSGERLFGAGHESSELSAIPGHRPRNRPEHWRYDPWKSPDIAKIASGGPCPANPWGHGRRTCGGVRLPPAATSRVRFRAQRRRIRRRCRPRRRAWRTRCGPCPRPVSMRTRHLGVARIVEQALLLQLGDGGGYDGGVVTLAQQRSGGLGGGVLAPRHQRQRCRADGPAGRPRGAHRPRARRRPKLSSASLSPAHRPSWPAGVWRGSGLRCRGRCPDDRAGTGGCFPCPGRCARPCSCTRRRTSR